jgi:hypothetical protein
VHFRISISNSNQQETSPTVRFYNSYTLIRNLGIDYFFVNKGRTAEYHKFLDDSEHFAVEFENEKIVIFKVLPHE